MAGCHCYVCIEIETDVAWVYAANTSSNCDNCSVSTAKEQQNCLQVLRSAFDTHRKTYCFATCTLVEEASDDSTCCRQETTKWVANVVDEQTRNRGEGKKMKPLSEEATHQAVCCARQFWCVSSVWSLECLVQQPCHEWG